MQKSWPVVPEGEFAPKKGGAAQRPYSYLETIDIFGLEAALVSAPSMRSAERKIKSYLRQSALSWTTFETSHPYSAEDAGKHTVEIPWAKKLFVVLSTKSRCFDTSTKLYVEDRGGEVDDSDSELGRTCMMLGSSFENRFVFVDGSSVTFHFKTG